jgi:hypothetical protein
MALEKELPENYPAREETLSEEAAWIQEVNKLLPAIEVSVFLNTRYLSTLEEQVITTEMPIRGIYKHTDESTAYWEVKRSMGVAGKMITKEGKERVIFAAINWEWESAAEDKREIEAFQQAHGKHLEAAILLACFKRKIEETEKIKNAQE